MTPLPPLVTKLCATRHPLLIFRVHTLHIGFQISWELLFMTLRLWSPALLAFLCLPIAAQVDHASLSGTVTDASGAVVQNATVETLSIETGFRRQTITGTGGTYEIPGLPIGVYVVTFSKQGFKPTQVNSVELVVGQPRTIDASLQVGVTTETVDVTGTLETV